MRTLILLAILAVPVAAQEVEPIRVQIPVDVLQEALTIHDTTVVSVEVRVELVADSAYQAGVDAALAGMEARGAGQAAETPTWARIGWLGVGVAAVWVIGHGLNKIANRIGSDVNVNVEGDDIYVVPPKRKKKPDDGGG